MNLMQNNYFGYVYGERIDEIIKECNLAKNMDIVKDDDIEKFFDWIKQYLQQGYYKTFIGYSLYEEDYEPILYYVEDEE